MKNLLKFGFLGLALTFMVAACNEPAQEEAQEVEINSEEVIVNEGDTLDTIIVEDEVINEDGMDETPEVN